MPDVLALALTLPNMAWLGFPRLKAPWGATAEQIAQAERDASGHSAESEVQWWLPALGATERRPELHLLWQHSLRSQVLPEAMRRLPRNELEYLAAHSGEAFFTTQTGELLRGQIEKLRANADRARYELERRDRVRAAFLTTVLAAAVGGGVGGLVVALV